MSSWHHPYKKGSLVVNLLTMPYLNMITFFAPNPLKSQETNFIVNHLKGCMSVKMTGYSLTVYYKEDV